MISKTEENKFQDEPLSQLREVRVFISSSFSDMRQEREELAKFVFPRLRSICTKHGIVFTGVDLRWGITEEQVLDQKALEICLEEVDSCRPFFIGIFRVVSILISMSATEPGVIDG